MRELSNAIAGIAIHVDDEAAVHQFHCCPNSWAGLDYVNTEVCSIVRLTQTDGEFKLIHLTGPGQVHDWTVTFGLSTPRAIMVAATLAALDASC